MIDEKKIEDAAKNALSVCVHKKEKEHEIVILGRGDYIDAFKAGINWFLDNLWHDASEEPEVGRRVIVMLKNREGQDKFYISDRDPMFNWQEEVKVCGFIRWFYADDLLKGGE